jgi:hypothetical protein
VAIACERKDRGLGGVTLTVPGHNAFVTQAAREGPGALADHPAAAQRRSPMPVVIAKLRRRAPIVWLIGSTGFGLAALALMLADSAWPLPVLMAVVQAALLAAGTVGFLDGDSAPTAGKDRAGASEPLPRRQEI